MECKQKYKFLAIKSFSFSGDDSKKLSIMANIYKLISQEKSILDHWQSSSEWTIIIKIWANVFETLFEDTMIELIWGDTKNDPFKIDLRLCVVVDKKKHDVSNTEFKKNGNRSERKKDTAKLLTEGKQILNELIKLHNLDLEESKKKRSMVVQVCGLKALITEVRLVAPGCYMPNQFGKTLKYPYDLKSAKLFLKQSLQQLFAYKDHVIEEAQLIRGALRKDTSSLGSTTATEDQYFIKQVYHVQDSMKTWPKMNNDIFKQ
ncbi:hypothetical protein CU098_005772 [Rhizopus stolonifer]|uniref:Uncharacterized protein n=1 Tax=Rhizopus stolonifer TaxID=4846 RepID=A0A367IPR5_RHIST|nr:hypothetical protein CU098_005772 [Rhizopus stolonifer]